MRHVPRDCIGHPEGGQRMSLKKHPVIFILVTVFALYFCAETVQAARIIIKPRVATSWQSDSNFFKAETVEREVFTYIFQPGIDLGFETAKTNLVFNYTLNASYYDDQDTVPAGERDANEDDFIGHTALFKARHRLFDRLLIGLDESYMKTRDAADSDDLSNSVDRNKYTINRVSPMLFYDFGEKFTAGLRYRNTETNYSEGTLEDSSEHRGIFDLIYNLTRTESLDLEYQHWERSYDKTTSDYASDQIVLIFRKQFQYATLEVGGGYHERDFDQAGLDTIDTLAYRVALNFQNPPAPDARPKTWLDLSATMNFNDQGLSDSYYTAHRFSLDVGHIFLEKIKVSVGGYYQNSDYERETGLTPGGATEYREDDTYYVSLSVGYMFTDWLTLSLTAGYEERDSNLQGRDYDNESIMARLEFSHDLGGR
jgi:hypothetical protein